MLNKIIFSFVLMFVGAVSASPYLSGHQSVESAQATKTTVSKPVRSNRVETLIHHKLLYDPMSPVVGAEHPVLKIVSFVNYDCKHCKQLDKNLERLLKAYPQIAITYKLISYGSEASTAATRMALTVWIEQPEKFHKFHQALMAYPSMADDYRIRSALFDAKVKLNKIRPDTHHIIEVNKELLRTHHYSGTPTTFIGDRVISGAVPYEELKNAVDQALKDM
ncbi:thioredoxin domain-containing protein [Pantoea sp. C8B4]|uniref:thioredoxin domain-containing protein n=1 Tax=Pantoea sp. C8B4 TaxID=3243083 RepID=UPI003ED8A9BD